MRLMRLIGLIHSTYTTIPNGKSMLPQELFLHLRLRNDMRLSTRRFLVVLVRFHILIPLSSPPTPILHQAS